MQPMPENPKKMKPLNQHAYVVLAPTITFQVQGADASSATQIRNSYIKGNDDSRMGIIQDLYGEMDKNLKDIFDRRLLPVEKMQEFVYEMRQRPTEKGVALLERVMRLEREALREFDEQQTESIDDDESADYIEEKWSKKYKSSINCNNPKGFSQRAHCQGRKKK
jgi:hypothetical protein